MVTPQRVFSSPESPSFIAGMDYRHPTGEIVRFEDESWCISSQAGKRTTLYFQVLPKWLLRPAKLAVAHGWLTEGKSIDWCKKTFSAFTRIAALLTDFKGESMAELSNEHTIILQRRFTAEVARYDEEMAKAASNKGRPLTSEKEGEFVSVSI
jgi:hypothetical protein